MERDINNFLEKDPYSSPPYVNHMGGGNLLRNSWEYINYEPKQNYNGKDIINFNGNKTYFVDGYLLYVKHFRFPWIKGEIVKNDFTTQTCYLSRVNNKFAISDSIKSVFNELKEQINQKKYNDADIARAFVMCHPDYNKQYQWGEMLEWHTLSLNSCENGRKVFSSVCNKKYNDLTTPKEFIELILKYSPATSIGKEMEKLYTNV